MSIENGVLNIIGGQELNKPAVELMTRKQRKQKAKDEGKKFIPINGYQGSKDDGWYND